MSLSGRGVNTSASTDHVSSIFLICFSMLSSFWARSTISLHTAAAVDNTNQHMQHAVDIIVVPASLVACQNIRPVL